MFETILFATVIAVVPAVIALVALLTLGAAIAGAADAIGEGLVRPATY